MTKKRTSIIWTTDTENLQKLLDNSSSFVEVLKSLGLSAHSGNHRTLHERIKIDNLNLEILQSKRKEKIRLKNKNKKINVVDIFVANSNFSTKTAKNKVMQENLILYKCAICGNEGDWNGKKLVLQLEHKNGDSKDHRLENLCFLCPNCHSQTETFSGRNTKKPKKAKYCLCGKEIRTTSTSCVKCASNKDHLQKFHVTKEDLEIMIAEMPITKIGIIFGVSDNAVRKRCKRFGIDFRKRKSG